MHIVYCMRGNLARMASLNQWRSRLSEKAGILIQDGVHEEDVIDWFEFVTETE